MSSSFQIASNICKKNLLSQIFVLKEIMSNYSLTTSFTPVMIIQATSYSPFSQLFLVYVSLSLIETVPCPQLSTWLCTDPRMDLEGNVTEIKRNVYTGLMPWKITNAQCVCPVRPALGNTDQWSFINVLLQELKHSMTHYRDSMQFPLARQITLIY